MTDAYAVLPLRGPYEARIGRALITLVEPHPGCEREFNRWYEDDHFVAGAMAVPWLFAGRRWVATRELQLLRQPADSRLAQPPTKGCYLATYWISAGRYEDCTTWLRETNIRLNKDGRIYQKRDHIFTSYQDYIGVAYRDGRDAMGGNKAGPRDIHALNYPYAGLVLEVVEAPDPGSRAALERWLMEQHLPARLKNSPAAMCLAFRTEPMPEPVPEYLTRTMEVKRNNLRVTLLWFLEADPRECWQRHFAGEADAVAAGGRGRMDFCAPFIPTIHGTDRYSDELR